MSPCVGGTFHLREGELGAWTVQGGVTPQEELRASKVAPSPANVLAGWMEHAYHREIHLKMHSKTKSNIFLPYFFIVSMDNTNTILWWHRTA